MPPPVTRQCTWMWDHKSRAQVCRVIKMPGLAPRFARTDVCASPRDAIAWVATLGAMLTFWGLQPHGVHAEAVKILRESATQTGSTGSSTVLRRETDAAMKITAVDGWDPPGPFHASDLRRTENEILEPRSWRRRSRRP